MLLAAGAGTPAYDRAPGHHGAGFSLHPGGGAGRGVPDRRIVTPRRSNAIALGVVGRPAPFALGEPVGGFA